jgi:hypothetical protein
MPPALCGVLGCWKTPPIKLEPSSRSSVTHTGWAHTHARSFHEITCIPPPSGTMLPTLCGLLGCPKIQGGAQQHTPSVRQCGVKARTSVSWFNVHVHGTPPTQKKQDAHACQRLCTPHATNAIGKCHHAVPSVCSTHLTHHSHTLSPPCQLRGPLCTKTHHNP